MWVLLVHESVSTVVPSGPRIMPYPIVILGKLRSLIHSTMFVSGYKALLEENADLNS